MRLCGILSVLLLATYGTGGSAKRKMSKKGRRAAGVLLTPRIDSIKMRLQDGQLSLDEGIATLVGLDDQAKQPADVAALNAVLGELYRHVARQQPGAVRRRTEHSAVARFLRAADTWGHDSRSGIEALRMAADTAHDLSGGCSSELQFALEVQEQYAAALGAENEEGQTAWAQLAQYQYFRQDFEGVLRSLSVIEEGGNSGSLPAELQAMCASLTGSALKQLERYEESLWSLQHTLSLLQSDQVDVKRQTTIHLGEALQRMGRRDEADALWQQGVADGWFPSTDQRPGNLYSRPLPSRPVWDVRDPSNSAGVLRDIVDELETTSVWTAIQAESRAAIAAGHFTVDPGSITRYRGGAWYHLVLYEYGLKDIKNCRRVPKTCATIESLAKGAVAQNTQGQVKLSLMSPGIHVLPHCGPTNTRVRMHLGLCIPAGVDLKFTVGGENASWTEGKVTVFDDSFEHEIIFPGDETSSAVGGEQQKQPEEQPPPTALALIDTGRLVLLFDTWHPSLTSAEIASVRATKQLHAIHSPTLFATPSKAFCGLWHVLGATGQDTGACDRKQSRV
jgi:hypothetical protein